jgi:hypothetical protein
MIFPSTLGDRRPARCGDRGSRLIAVRYGVDTATMSDRLRTSVNQENVCHDRRPIIKICRSELAIDRRFWTLSVVRDPKGVFEQSESIH